VPESALTNVAVVAGTYTGPVAPGASTQVVDTDRLTRTVEDLAMTKRVEPTTFTQGGIATYTLRLRVSEYVDVTNAVITDTLPNGLCPLSSSTNHTTGPNASECGPLPGADPTGASYDQVTQNPDGTFTVRFTGLDVDADGTAIVRYQARMRTVYTGGALAGRPTVSGDTFTNTVAVQGSTTPVPGTGESGTVTVADTSDATLTSESLSIDKTVRARTVGPAGCETGQYSDPAPDDPAFLFRQGDLICFQLAVTFPATSSSRNVVVTDFLPPDTAYVPGSAFVVTSPGVDVVFNETDAASGQANPTWRVGDPQGDDRYVPPGATLVVRLAAQVLRAADPGDLDLVGNLMKLRAEDSSGRGISRRDEVQVRLAPPPEVSILKGVQSIQDNGTGAPRVLDPTLPDTPGENVDGPEVRQGDVVTFRVDVTNQGEAALGNDNSIRGWQVWDVLPDGVACDDVVGIGPTGGAGSPAGTCTDPGDAEHPSFTGSGTRSSIRWVASPGVQADADGSRISANSTRTLTYQVRIPSEVGVGTAFTNTAHVRSFDVFTNVQGTTTTYFPARNVDTSVPAADYNAPQATDPSQVVVPDTALTKVVVSTGVNESNNTDAQATNGETVTYRLGVTIPARTSVYRGVLTDVLPDDLVFLSASAAFSATGATPATGALLPGFSFDPATGTVTFPSTWTNSSDTPQRVEVTLQARMTPTAVAHGQTKTNTATFTRSAEDDPAAATSSQTATGEVQLVVPNPTLRKTNTVTPPVVAGSVVTYTLRISNESGRPPLHDAVVVDCLPGQLEFGSFAVGTAGTTSTSPGTGTGTSGNGCATGSTRIEWRPGLPVLAGGGNAISAIYTATIKDNPAGGATYTNTATLTGSTLQDGVNDSAVEAVLTRTASSRVTVGLADITKTVTPDALTFGERARFTVVATLPRQITFWDASVIDELPRGFDPDSVQTTSTDCERSDGSACTLSITPLTPAAGPGTASRVGWYLGDVASSSVDTRVTITYTALLSNALAAPDLDQGDTLTNRARVGWNLTDGPAPTSAGASFGRFSGPAAATVTVREPLVSVVKTVNDTTPEPGDTVTYTVTISNATGDLISPAHSLQVLDRVPAGVVVQGVGDGVTVGGSPTTGGGTITWSIPGPLLPGASVTRTYTARLADSTTLTGDPLTNTVTVDDYATSPAGSPGLRPYPDRDPTAAADVTPQFPRLEVSKTTPNGSLAYIDEGFTWQITVRNTGTATAFDVEFSDTLPPNWRFVPGSFVFSLDGGQVAAANPVVDVTQVGGSFVETITGRAPVPLPPGSVGLVQLGAVPVNAEAGSVVQNPGVGTQTDHTNTANVAATDGAGSTGNAAGSYVAGPASADAQIASADLVVDKSSPGEAVAGEQLAWTIKVRNAGPDDALRRVTVTDTLPSDDPATDPVLVSVVGDGYTCSVVRRVVTCERDMTTTDGSPRPFASGTEETLTVVVEVPSDVPAGTVYENTARVTSATFDPDSSNNTDTDPVTVDAEADLAIIKKVTGPVVAGTVATYTLDVRNNGPSTARADVQVVDTLPAGAQFRGFTGAGWQCEQDPGDARRVVCLLDGDLPAGTPAPQLAIRVLVASSQTTAVTNSAQVESTTTRDPKDGNNTSTVTTPVQTVADVLLEKESAPPPDFVPGEDEAVYRFRAYNAGPSDAGPLTLTDLLPAGVTFVEVLEPADGWTCSAQPGAGGREDLTCARASGLVDEAETVVAVRVALDPGLGGGDPTQVVTLRNEATVTSTTTDPVPGNNTDDDVTTSTREADLVLTKSHGPEPVTAGTALTFTLALTNEGRSTATAPVVVRDRLDDAFAFTGFGTTSGWDCRHDGSPTGGLVTCTLGETEPADLAVTDAPPIEVEVEVLPSAGPAQVRNTATAGSLTPDPVLPNNVGDDLVTVVDEADVGIVKTATGADPVRAGETTQFTLETSNDGPSDADAVSVTDRLPRGLLLDAVVAPAPWECSGAGTRDLVCTYDGSLPPGDAPAIVITARVAPDVPDGEVLTNTARVATSTPQGENTLPDESSDTAAVIARADLTVTKALVQPESACDDVCAGEPVAFTLQVTNEGPSTAVPRVRLLDTLPAGITFTGASDPEGAWRCSADEPNPSGQSVACVLTDPATGTPVPLDPTQPGVPGSGRAPLLTLDGVVDPATDPSTLTNEVLVTSPTVDPAPGNNDDVADVVVEQLVDLGITKTHTGPVRIGDALTFTLEVTNAGPSQARQVRVRDTLPRGLDDPVVQPLDDAPWACEAGDVTDAGTPLDCLLADPLAPGATAAFTVTVLVGAEAFPSATNVADVSTQTPEVDDPGELPDSASDTVQVPPQVDLSVVKTHRGEFAVGEPGQFVLTVANAGPTLDPGPVTVTDRVPSGLRPTAASGEGWDCAVAGQTVTCTDADGLGVDEQTRIVVTVDVLPQAVPSVTNAATVGSDAEDVQPTNNRSEDVVPVRGMSVLTLTKEVGSTGGDRITWTIAVTNEGPNATEQPIVVRDSVPAGLQVTAVGGRGWECPVEGRTVTCTYEQPLDAGATASFDVTTTISPAAAGTTVRNVATGVYPGCPDGCTLVADATVDVPGSGLLPPTGATLQALAAITLVLLAAGLALLTAARRHSPQP
jgi:large repetitive protein